MAGMTAPRVYAPEAVEGRDVLLPGDEGTHLVRVLRLGPGARVRVFDGAGAEFDGEISAVARAAVHVRVASPVPAVEESPVRMVVAPALIKGDGFDEIVRDAVMMGAASVRPVVTERTVVKPRDGMAARWQRVALAAAKQSGRAVLPAVDPPVSLDQLLASDASAARLVFVEPSGDVLATDVLTLAAPASALIVIGPEGGWSPAELEMFKERAVTFARIGGRTITAERATIAALAVLTAAWERG
jgi:16S rRNA (uracil1498-N3)-methyltransferase